MMLAAHGMEFLQLCSSLCSFALMKSILVYIHSLIVFRSGGVSVVTRVRTITQCPM